ncbi:hypothetical protein LTR41_007953 [Exophiala xenobiotica]|nr:hypothetical protein LTR41_007953 [Exophiala xenobiotica]KAK5553790.1 hypothetical protein LTR46_008336 [Exophiala xenobiotica]
MSQVQHDNLAATMASVDLNDGDGRVDNIEATVAVNGTETPENTVDADADAEEEQDYGEIVHDLPPPEAKKKKKKKNRKPASKRGLGKPTGFEDFFADTPMTPSEHAEEQELYHPNITFVDRLLTAIARFERTRKLTPERRDMFYKYLGFGSVEVGPNAHQGGIGQGQDTEDMDRTQLLVAMSQASISDDKRNLGTPTSLYDVDFQGVMKAFLSRRARLLYGFELRDQVSLLTTTLERFMDYLLQHDVCPEYRDDVLATRNLCRDSTSELWDVAEATRRLPGDFNIACSTLFGGYYAENYDGTTDWEEGSRDENVFVGMKPEEAQQVIHFGVAGAADEPVYKAYAAAVNGGGMLAVDSIQEHAGFQITKIEPPTAECKELYTTTSQHFRPVGRVYAKPWTNPDQQPEDLTAAEKEALTTIKAPKDDDKKQYIFFVESILQSHLRVGMKVEATIRTLNCGIMFFDDVLNAFPTFDEYVVNELMAGWKAPRAVKGAFDYIEAEIEGEGEGEGEDEARDGGPENIDEGEI